ncbi:Methyltransferase protein 17 mitochondrial [Fasciola gigantica]|uniref:Methyltransferase protein 17 mitochondrial n=1 Tax=Fasciola gigantica TaxID=46835 RepID=A0A504YVU0_FASGI|nr:Methyltransferase protein 17 mitochondrial [Fasciola gigantica]
MSYTAKLINGSLRYRAMRALQSILRFPPGSQNSSYTPKVEGDGVDAHKGSATSRLRQYPFFLSLPALALPSQLDAAAINYLRDYSISSPKAIEDRAEMLRNYLWSRPLMTEVCKFFAFRALLFFELSGFEAFPRSSQNLHKTKPTFS